MMLIKPFDLNKTWCDWAKFIAAILVAVSHYSTVVCINYHWSNSDFLRLWCQGGNLGVALFFFLSGYGLMESEKMRHLVFGEFVRRRFAKVYLPALMVSVIWVFTCIIFKTHYNTSSLWEILYDLLWGFNDSVLWFVKILFALYGLFFLFSVYRNAGKYFLSIVVLLFGTVITQYMAFEFGFPYINVPLFTIGVIASLFKEKQLFKCPVGFSIIILMSLIYSIMFVFIKDNRMAHQYNNRETYRALK